MKRLPILVTLCLLVPAVASAGLVIESVRYSDQSPDREKWVRYIQSNRVKEISPDGRYTLWNLNTGVFYRVDPAKKTYAGETLLAQIQEKRRALARLKALADEARKKTGKSQPWQMPLKSEVKATGQFATIAGYDAQRFEVYVGGQLSGEIWLTKDVDLKQEVNYRVSVQWVWEWEQELTALAQELNAPVSLVMAPDVSDHPDRAGLELRRISHLVNSTQVKEVVKIERRDLPESEFQVPAGFRRVTMDQYMKED